MAHADAVKKRARPTTVTPIRKELDVSDAVTITGKTRPKVAVLIPAYNEERFIGSVVLRASRYADCVVVVDDGSADGTAEVAKAAGAIVVRHERNQGKGVALNTGFRAVRELDPEVVVTLDADGQHVPEEISAVTAPVLRGDADIVVGSRYLANSSKVPAHRVWGHRVFNYITNRVSGLAVTDSQSGFRAFSPRALATISFNSSGFSVESEMQLLAREHHLRVNEVSITIQYLDKPKRSVITHGLMVLSGLLQLVGQYRPLLFFGAPGVILLAVGVMLGAWVVEIYRATQTLAVGYTLLSVLVTTLAVLSLFTGIMLHSVRGMLLNLVHPQN